MTAVLVVDDEPTFARTLCRELAQHGFEMFVSSTAEQGVEVLRKKSITVLITDLRMRGTADGIELLERARRASPSTRTILMSGYASARDYARAVELGAVKVLCKPFSMGELLEAVRQAVDCESGFRGSLHGFTLIDVLQMLHFSRRPLRLNVESASPGSIFMRDGRIFHAECGGATGEAALQLLLAHPDGVVSTVVLAAATPETVAQDRGFEVVLLDALRAIDEATTREAAPPRSAASDRGQAAECFERGHELLRARDLVAARSEWERALSLAPENRIYQANLRRLSRLMSAGESNEGE